MWSRAGQWCAVCNVCYVLCIVCDCVCNVVGSETKKLTGILTLNVVHGIRYKQRENNVSPRKIINAFPTKWLSTKVCLA